MEQVMPEASNDRLGVLRQVHVLVHDAWPLEQQEPHEPDKQRKPQREATRRRRWWPPRWWRRRSTLARDRLLAKALGSLHDRLTVAQRLYTARPPDRCRLENFDVSLAQAGRVLQDEDRRRDEETIWLLDHELRCALVEMGDVGYLHVCIDEELERDPNVDPPYLRLDMAQLKELSELRDKLAKQNPEDARHGAEPAVDRAIQVLTRRYHRREHAQRHDRARNARRGQLLNHLAISLSVFVVLLAGIISYGLDVSWQVVSVVLLSAMLGSAISGTRKLRDELLRIGELDAFGMASLAQLAVGAGLGLVVLLLLKADMLPAVNGVEPSSWIFAVYAFAAGLSEPFVIGVVQRLVSIDSKPR